MSKEAPVRSLLFARLAPVCAPVLATLVLLAVAPDAAAQSGPTGYRLVDDWASFPDGREIGAVGDVKVDPDGQHVWAVIRCEAEFDQFGYECLDSDLDPIIKFDMDGRVVESFGGGMFIWPHGIALDDDGNVYVTDAVSPGRVPDDDERGHQVVKFSPTGEVLLVLGTPGTAGDGPNQMSSPSDVVVAENGDIFVTDGHNANDNNRILKFSADGTLIGSWGHTGWAPGEFQSLHTIGMDDQGRLFVGDRGANRIQIFDQDGEFIAIWTQFGKPSGIDFDDHGNIYVADSESDNLKNPGWDMGIRIGESETGWVREFIPYMWGDPDVTLGTGAEFVTVDPQGNLYGGEPVPRRLQKYVRVRP
ncbi:MAG: peptidyl-alpha-hydroxyglycine alpha-amidating lyase family protein [Gemmatimonadota bacterium]